MTTPRACVGCTMISSCATCNTRITKKRELFQEVGVPSTTKQKSRATSTQQRSNARIHAVLTFPMGGNRLVTRAT
jgi:hypothetical protein